MSEEPWYGGGLRFECTRCGNCCTGAPGTVRVTDDEQAALARRLGLEPDAFRREYTRLLPDGELSLVERANHDCVFWDRERGCTVYVDRPRQCRTWPFWRGNLASEAHWESAAEGCPGMGSGRTWTRTEIEERTREDGTSGIVPDLVEYEWPGDEPATGEPS